MSKINVLVTGGAGFIGSSLVNQLCKSGKYFVVVVDNLLTGDHYRLEDNPHLKFIKANVNKLKDISSVFYSHQFEYVFHYAAVVGVKRTLNNPVMVLDDISGMKNILDLSKNTGVKRVFFSSSSEVYGEPVELPQNEDTTPLNSRLPYAIVKNVGEAFLKSYKQEFGLDYTIFRFFNTYGPLQSKDFVISKFISAALKNEDITIYGDGNQSRTFCYIDDNINASMRAFEEDQCINEVINIGSDNEFKIIELAQIIKKLCKSNSKIIHLPPLEEGDMSRRLPDTEKMKALIGYEPIKLEEGLTKLLENKAYIMG
jgi:UDP-glucose 4-epimerase